MQPLNTNLSAVGTPQPEIDTITTTAASSGATSIVIGADDYTLLPGSANQVPYAEVWLTASTGIKACYVDTGGGVYQIRFIQFSFDGTNTLYSGAGTDLILSTTLIIGNGPPEALEKINSTSFVATYNDGAGNYNVNVFDVVAGVSVTAGPTPLTLAAAGVFGSIKYISAGKYLLSYLNGGTFTGALDILNITGTVLTTGGTPINTPMEIGLPTVLSTSLTFAVILNFAGGVQLQTFTISGTSPVVTGPRTVQTADAVQVACACRLDSTVAGFGYADLTNVNYYFFSADCSGVSPVVTGGGNPAALPVGAPGLGMVGLSPTQGAIGFVNLYQSFHSFSFFDLVGGIIVLPWGNFYTKIFASNKVMAQYNALTVGPNDGMGNFIITDLIADPAGTPTLGNLVIKGTATGSSIAGKSWYFSTTTVESKHQPWYKVSGVGPAPTPLAGYTLLEVDVLTTDTATDVATATAAALVPLVADLTVGQVGSVLTLTSTHNEGQTGPGDVDSGFTVVRTQAGNSGSGQITNMVTTGTYYYRASTPTTIRTVRLQISPASDPNKFGGTAGGLHSFYLEVLDTLGNTVMVSPIVDTNRELFALGPSSLQDGMLQVELDLNQLFGGKVILEKNWLIQAVLDQNLSGTTFFYATVQGVSE
jgi:hypothetical protein